VNRLCILHANCQGGPLAFLLNSVPEFAAAYTVRRVVNYRRTPIPEEIMAACSLFLFQPLGDEWDELTSSRLRERLPGKALCLQLPNMFFKGYWPFWTNAGPMDFGDSFLDHMVEQGLSLAEAKHVYLRGGLESKFDLDAIAAGSLDREREKERCAVVGTADVVAQRWKREQMFSSVNHPGRHLCLHVAGGVLSALGMPPVPHAARDMCPPCNDDLDLPIHPGVGRHFGLPFAGADRRYNIFGRSMTFEQYITCYLHCRMQGGHDFTAWLHSAPL
jgi:hypothetical protein